MNQDLINYIRHARTKGDSNEQITEKLKEKNWKDDEINEAFQEIQATSHPILITSQKNKLRLSIIGIVALVLSIVGAFIFVVLKANTWDPSRNPPNLSPQEVIAQMVNKNSKITFFEIESFFETLQDTGSGTDSLIKITSHDFIDESNYEEPKSLSNALITIGTGSNVQPFKAKVIFIGKLGYMQINSKWSGMETSNPFYSLFNPSDPRYSESPELYFGDPALYTIEREFPNEKLNGINVYHYKLSLNPKVILRVDPELEELPSSISAELWIDKQSSRLLQTIIITKMKDFTNDVKLEFSYPKNLDSVITLPNELLKLYEKDKAQEPAK